MCIESLHGPVPRAQGAAPSAAAAAWGNNSRNTNSLDDAMAVAMIIARHVVKMITAIVAMLGATMTLV